jgi:8-oxo-dGTP pyrophosphatase MutT (NUDIX family)
MMVNRVTLVAERIEVAIEPWLWQFAVTHRGAIDRHFAELQRQRPAVWNGRVVLLNRYQIHDGVFRGSCFETDYASLIAWRDWGFPDPSVHNIFAAAALRGADGAYLVGEMGQHTASAHQLYFPCGTPEPLDTNDRAQLDLQENLRRELHEETGLDIEDLTAEPGWTLVQDRGFMAFMKLLTARQNADELRHRILRHLATERQPELSDIYIVRGRAQLDSRMPPFVIKFLEAAWAQ